MSRSPTIWKDSLRLILLLVVSPIILLLAGPVLTVVAIKGRLSLGGLTLNPGKHRHRNREIAFVMGVVGFYMERSRLDGICFLFHPYSRRWRFCDRH